MEIFNLTADDLWVIATGAATGIACSLVGVFLVVRRMAMLGDAISHSVLFGIVVSFLITGSRSFLPMLIGAGSVGVLTAYITNVLNSKGKLQEDASIGVTFTWLFALGVILISLFASSVDLDQECVLYGEISFVPFTRFVLFGYDLGALVFWNVSLVLLINLVFVALGFERLKTISFDLNLARTSGISISFWHYSLMTLVSITTVASFDAVGAILVVAMLVIPANASYLLAKDLSMMLILAAFFAFLSAVIGYIVSMKIDASPSASMVLAAGGIFIIIFSFKKMLGFFKRGTLDLNLAR